MTTFEEFESQIDLMLTFNGYSAVSQLSLLDYVFFKFLSMIWIKT